MQSNKALLAVVPLLMMAGSAWAAVDQVPLPVPIWDRPIEHFPATVQTPPPVQSANHLQGANPVQSEVAPGRAAPVQSAASLQPIPANKTVLLHKIHGFVWGQPTAPAKAIVFIDPNCVWCHRFFEQVQAGVKAGYARYLIVPVAILKKSSLPKAERILQAKNPQVGVLRNETRFGPSHEEGGLPQTFPGASKTSLDLVEINTAVLADLEGEKHTATPTFVVTTPQGPALHEGFVSREAAHG